MNVALHTIELFAGVGMLGEGLRAGLRYLGIETRTVCYLEREAYPAAVLAARMAEGALDDAPVWSDVCTFDARAWRGAVDCVIGGFPCQDLSLAGRRAGLDGKRSGLFFELLRIAEDSGARHLFLENVGGIASATASVVDAAEGELDERAASRVVGELADRGWNAEWLTLSASDVGASHGRERWFCWAWRELGHADHERAHRSRTGAKQDRSAKPANSDRSMGNTGLQHQYLQQREDGADVDDPQRAERRASCSAGAGGQQGGDGRRHEAHGGTGESDEVLGHPGLQHQHLQQREDGAEHKGTSDLMECEFCGYEFPDSCGRYGCPNCEGEGLADTEGHGRHQGRPEPGREQGRSDAAERRGAVADSGSPRQQGRELGTTRNGNRGGQEAHRPTEQLRRPFFAPGPADARWPAILREWPWLAPALGRRLNPMFGEFLMGWPIGWADANNRTGGIDAYRQSLDEELQTLLGADGAKANQWPTGGLHGFSETQILRPEVHGRSDVERRPEPQRPQQNGKEDWSETSLREMRNDAEAGDPSSGQELEKQRSEQLADPLRFVSYVVASCLRGNKPGATKAAVHVLRETKLSSRCMQHLSDSDKDAWDAISEAERADLVIEAAAVSHSKIQRAQRLKCVGNGVVALQAAAAAVVLVRRMMEAA